MTIKISKEIREVCPKITLGVLKAKVNVIENVDEIKELLNNEVIRIQKNFTMENYKNEALENARRTYRKLGKDPTRYRISSDSLFRRIIKNKGVYYVNNIVDINNIISLKTLWSIGAYDLNKISGNLEYKLGKAEDVYEGIGRGILNIEKLPVLSDENGPFGSAMSDSLRTMVTSDTKELMMVIHSFNGNEEVESYLKEIEMYLIKYANGEDISIEIL